MKPLIAVSQKWTTKHFGQWTASVSTPKEQNIATIKHTGSRLGCDQLIISTQCTIVLPPPHLCVCCNASLYQYTHTLQIITMQIHLLVHYSGHVNNVMHLGDDGSIWIQFTKLAVMKLYDVFQITNIIFCEARGKQIVHYFQHQQEILPVLITLRNLTASHCWKQAG